MSPLVLKFQLHYPGMAPPKKAHGTDAGLDLTCMAVEQKGERLFFLDTGVSLEPPEGYYAELYPRSSMAKSEFVQANSVGIIDGDYRGKVLMPVRYLGSGDPLQAALALVGQRVGQLVLKRMEIYEVQVVSELNNTQRGSGGFGSTGA